MMCAWSVSRSISALQSRVLGMTGDHSENGRLVVTVAAAFSARSAMTWNSSSPAFLRGGRSPSRQERSGHRSFIGRVRG